MVTTHLVAIRLLGSMQVHLGEVQLQGQGQASLSVAVASASAAAMQCIGSDPSHRWVVTLNL